MKRLINNISSLQFYQLGRYSALLLIGVVFTKTSLSQIEIGEYETFLFLAGFVSFFWLNGFLKALLPLAGRKNDESEITRGVAIFNSFVLLSVFSIVFALFLIFAHPLFSDIFLNNKEIRYINYLVIFIIFGVPSNLTEYIYLLNRKNLTIIYYTIISFSLQFLMVVIPPVLGYGIEMALLGLVIFSIIRYIWLWKVMFQYADISFSWTFIKEYFRLGWPLVLAVFLSGSAQYVDGFIVTSHFNEAAFAVFRYGARELPLALILANALSMSMLSEMNSKEKLKANLVKLKLNAKRLTHLLFPLSAVLLVLSHFLFPVVFNAEFSESATIFNIYILLVISRLLFPQTILIGLKQTRIIMQASFFELILNITLSLIFVGIWGISGIAFATVIAYMFEKIFLMISVKSRLKINLSQYAPVKLHVIYSIALIILFIFVEIFFT